MYMMPDPWLLQEKRVACYTLLMHVKAWAGPYVRTRKYTEKINLQRRGQAVRVETSG